MSNPTLTKPDLWLNKIVVGVDVAKGGCFYISGPGPEEGTVVLSREDFVKVTAFFKGLKIKLTHLKKAKTRKEIQKIYG